MGDYGEFEEVKEADVSGAQTEEQQVQMRVRMPRGREIIGTVVQLLGGNRMEIKCADGNTRNCRVPGRFKRSMWIKPGNIVLIEPWENEDKKGDIVFQYHFSAVNQLRKRGLLGFLKNEF